MRVAVIGGSAAGIFTALVLARRGHAVVLLERDDLDVAPDVEAAARAAFRPAAPQVVQPHVVQARCRELMVTCLPDVHRAVLAAGAVDAPLETQMPATLPDRSARPGDELLTLLMTRRSTFDWVLRQAVLDQDGVEVRAGEAVTGLAAVTSGEPGIAQVTGVHTTRGVVPADLVVDASGRRTRLDTWLADIGAPASTVRSAECGVSYYTRHYRIRDAAAAPGGATTRVVVGLDEFGAGIWGADNDTVQLGLLPLAHDRRFRSAGTPDVFESVLRTIPYYASWLPALEPISEVHPMGALRNSLRRLVTDGRPVAGGLHVLGDAACTTNPVLGRGLSLALQQAVDLAESLDRSTDTGPDLVRELDRRAEQFLRPYYEEQVAADSARLAALRHAVLGAPAPVRVPSPDRTDLGELRAAAPFDPVVFRAYWTVMGLRRMPDDVYGDPEVVARTRAVLASRASDPPAPQPSRAELDAALAPARLRQWRSAAGGETMAGPAGIGRQHHLPARCGVAIHQCPKCELRFDRRTELDHHCREDHPDFHHDYPGHRPTTEHPSTAPTRAPDTR